MIDSISRHIRELVAESCQVKLRPIYIPLYFAAKTAALEIADAFDAYYISQDRKLLHRNIVMSLLTFQDVWHVWLNKLQDGDLPHRATKVLHEMLLRFSKGALKAYRIWLTDLQK